ncbi:hypothetical protein BG004_004493 [Podila humilis]|nr:hypothetical protein BG004_004493 [Podila humilis]
MTSVHGSSTHAFTRPRGFVASASHLPRKNSGISSAATPVLSSFAIDLIAQFDNYRVNMRESLQREVEENIQKAKILKEAMKESSELEAEMAHAEEQQQEEQMTAKLTTTAPNNRSNTSLNRPSHSPSQHPQQTHAGKPGSIMSNTATASVAEKRSRLDRIFGRKTSVHSNQSSATLVRNQVTPHPHPSSSNTASPTIKPSSTSTSGVPSGSTVTATNASGVDLNDLKYLPVIEGDEYEDEIQVLDRSMSSPNAGTATDVGADPGTEVKLHPTRAKTFALPKSLKNLKRRIAALRAKGTDLDAEQREREARERANGGVSGSEEKKKFTLIRLLPWKTSRKPATGTN